MKGEKLYQKSWPYTWCVKMEMEALVRFQMYFPIGTFRHFTHFEQKHLRRYNALKTMLSM